MNFGIGSKYDDNAEGLEVAQLLLNNGFDVNESIPNNVPPAPPALIQAAASGKINFVTLFLHTPGINIDKTTSNNDTALILTATHYSLNNQNFYGHNDAQLSRMLEIIYLLLAAGADTSIKDRREETFLDYAKKNEKIQEVYDQFKKSVNELLETAKEGKIDRASKLLTVLNINSKNEAGITALMRAAQNNEVKMVEFLLKQKANPNILDAQERTALQWALYAHPHTSKPVQKRTKEILELLIGAGAKKTKQAYLKAVRFGYPEDILTLLKI